MARRLTPAVATAARMSQRLHDLSERLDRTRGLLSARVDIVREQQNAAVLESMNRRARLQLRLQETVELLSIAAIVYYLAGLVGYIAKGLDPSDPTRRRRDRDPDHRGRRDRGRPAAPEADPRRPPRRGDALDRSGRPARRPARARRAGSAPAWRRARRPTPRPSPRTPTASRS